MTAALLCDQDGKVAICLDGCGQVHSPYWSASKSAAGHRRGTGHEVEVVHASVVLARICDDAGRPIRSI